MSQTNIRGPIYDNRQGSVPARQTFVVQDETSTDAISLCRIQASEDSPVIVEAQVAVTTADGGGTPTVSVGYTASGYTDLINAESTATAATGGTFLPASNAVGKKYLTADTQIYYKQGGTPDGAGVFTIILDLTTVNTGTIQS